jgi:2',3'-cyclic-nucleotide 2'-phosphodiesterase (5'-nucleotidase family)
MEYFKRFAFLVFLLLLPFVSYYFYWNKSVEKLDIVFTSEGHGHVLPSFAYREEGSPRVGGMSALGGYLSGLKFPYLLFDTGNFFQGTPEGVLTEGEIVIRLMNELGYDAFSLGKNDFDYGPETLRKLSKLAKSPILCTNLRDIDTGGTPGYVKEYLLQDFKDIKIGITSVLTDKVKKLVSQDTLTGLDFLKPDETLKDVSSNLKDQGARIIVLLSSLGEKKNKQIAQTPGRVDVILGNSPGHDEKRSLLVDRTIICSAKSDFTGIGHLRLYLSRTENRVLTYSYHTVPLYVDKYPAHSEVENILNRMLPEVSSLLNEKLGTSSVLLSHHLFGEQRKHGELALGNWQTDLMKNTMETDFAFQNQGSIRATLTTGDLTVRNIWELSPFGYTLVKMTLTGKQIKELLEQSASHDYSKLQVSGLKIIYNDSLPEGKRVLNIIATDEDEPEEIKMDKEYSLATTSFLARGGDGYAVFTQGTEIEEVATLLRDLEIDYIKNNSPINARIQGRLKNVSIETQ